MHKTTHPTDASHPDLRANNKLVIIALTIISILVVLGWIKSYEQALTWEPQAKEVPIINFIQEAVPDSDVLAILNGSIRVPAPNKRGEDVLKAAYFLNTPGPMGLKREKWIENVFQETMPDLELRKHNAIPLSDERINQSFRSDQQQVVCKPMHFFFPQRTNCMSCDLSRCRRCNRICSPTSMHGRTLRMTRNCRIMLGRSSWRTTCHFIQMCEETRLLLNK